MAKIKLMVEGGKASTTPAMAQTLGPLKMDMKQIISDINEKTSTYNGLKVPVLLNIHEKDKSYDISVSSPPAAELIKSSVKLAKGSGEPEKKKVANMSIEQLIGVAKMKMESVFTNDLKSAMKTVAGTCNSLGILIEGNDSKTFNQMLNEGKYDDIIKSGKTEVDQERIDTLKTQLTEVQIELDKLFAKKAKAREKAEEPKAEVVAKVETTEGEAAKPGEKKEEVAKTEDKKEVKKEEKK